MNTPSANAVSSEIEALLTKSHAEFEAVLAALPDDGWRKHSHNPGWVNGEILFHMVFGFILLITLIPMVRLWSYLPGGFSKVFAAILNASTGIFNVINGAGPRLAGRVLNPVSLGRLADFVYAQNSRMIQRIKADDWQRGMYFPYRWDSMFSEYMTIEQVFRYVVTHFNFHRGQLALNG
jgi:hypothetical protein